MSYNVGMECNECGVHMDELDWYENDGYCDQCLEDDAFDHLAIFVTGSYRILDEEIISCPEEEHVIMMYDQTHTYFKRAIPA